MMLVRTDSRSKTQRSWRRVAFYVATYVFLVGGINVIVAWDTFSLERLPAITTMFGLLLVGPLAIGFADRRLLRWIKQSHS